MDNKLVLGIEAIDHVYFDCVREVVGLRRRISKHVSDHIALQFDLKLPWVVMGEVRIFRWQL